MKQEEAQERSGGLDQWQVGSVYPDGKIVVHRGRGYYARLYPAIYQEQPLVEGTVATFLVNTHGMVSSVVMRTKDLTPDRERALKARFPQCSVLSVK